MKKQNTTIPLLLAVAVTAIFIAVTINDFGRGEGEYGSAQLFRLTTGLLFVGIVWYAVIQNRKKQDPQSGSQKTEE